MLRDVLFQPDLKIFLVSNGEITNLIRPNTELIKMEIVTSLHIQLMIFGMYCFRSKTKIMYVILLKIKYA